jgi:uncharacterized protein
VSESNVEIVRGIYAALAKMSDYGDVRVLVERMVTPDVEWAPIEAPRTFHGLAGVEEAFGAWFEAMEEFEVTLEEILDAGERVLAVTQHTARGKGSGLAADQRVFQVFTLRDGKVARFEEFADRGDALEAAGLPNR